MHRLNIVKAGTGDETCLGPASPALSHGARSNGPRGQADDASTAGSRSPAAPRVAVQRSVVPGGALGELA